MGAGGWLIGVAADSAGATGAGDYRKGEWVLPLQLITATCVAVIKALRDAGPVSIREAARRVGRDVKAVHADVTALLLAGVLDRTESGQVEFPYEAVKVEFLLEAA